MSSSKGSPKQPQRRPVNPVISLTQFAHAKSQGTRKAIENYKHKKQSKFNRNAGLLREYRKVMKSEGYEAGKGASRKRPLQEDEGGRNNDDEDYDRKRTGIVDIRNGDDNYNGDQKNVKKRHKADPFAKAKEMAKRSKEDRVHQREMKVKEQEENKKKLKQKQIRSRKLAKRTSRGQPVMKHVVSDLLEKVKKAVDG